MLRHAEPQPVKTGRRPATRDPLIDFLRAASLLVVVAWHWLFTVVIWHDGPHTSNPIGTTPGMWALTWVLQVMPVFFFVGGFAHLITWESVERDGGGYREFLRRRLSRLLRPTAVCLALMMGIRVVLSVVAPNVAWATSALMLVLSPLWFLGIYVGLVVVTPLAGRLHRATGLGGLVLLGAGAVMVDVLRFDAHVPGVATANLAIVWGFCHQLGFHWRTLTAASRRTAWALALAGFAGLVVLTNLGVYPRSMVGVPGEAISNMGPPTVCILALALLQVGIVLLVRERMTAWLHRPRPKRFTTWAGTRPMTVYLWHFPASCGGRRGGCTRSPPWSSPQDIQIGEAFAARVINAAMHGPDWPTTLLVWLYDEHGGYYDHVPPPPAVKPDNVAPNLAPTDFPGAYGRYGFRVPAIVVSPYARKDYVSHVVHDHTSILKLVETKWNLPALTYRDANADNLLDFLDLTSPPAFLMPPSLPPPANTTGTSSCAATGAGQIPPADAVTS